MKWTVCNFNPQQTRNPTGNINVARNFASKQIHLWTVNAKKGILCAKSKNFFSGTSPCATNRRSGYGDSFQCGLLLWLSSATGGQFGIFKFLLSPFSTLTELTNVCYKHRSQRCRSPFGYAGGDSLVGQVRCVCVARAEVYRSGRILPPFPWRCQQPPLCSELLQPNIRLEKYAKSVDRTGS